MRNNIDQRFNTHCFQLAYCCNIHCRILETNGYTNSIAISKWSAYIGEQWLTLCYGNQWDSRVAFIYKIYAIMKWYLAFFVRTVKWRIMHIISKMEIMFFLFYFINLSYLITIFHSSHDNPRMYKTVFLIKTTLI